MWNTTVTGIISGIDWIELVLQIAVATVGVIAAVSLYGRRGVR
ncbi:hypothetical protein AB0M44_32300 [Streptosporangium subroseum]